MTNSLLMRGHVRLSVENASGRPVRTFETHNDVVNTGRVLAARLLAGDTQMNVGPETATVGPVTHMAVGTGAEATAPDSTTLFSERTPRSSLGSVEVAVSDNSAVARFAATFQGEHLLEIGEETLGLREAALYTAANGGVMYNRVTFDEVILRRDHELTLQWEIEFPEP